MTAPKYLLDTDTCVHIRKRRAPALLERFGGLKPGDAAISVITYGELLFGAHKRETPAPTVAIIEAFAALVTPLPLPATVAGAYGVLRAHLTRRGAAIGGNDLWIAAHALAADLVLVSNTMRAFARVPGLRLENWLDP